LITFATRMNLKNISMSDRSSRNGKTNTSANGCRAEGRDMKELFGVMEMF
jgi:hypothetical protein